ncbi:hypothetical protein KJ903_00495 [Patescibacteria group bacterium]|nr:hypothetical protein [Patescibacteria group bacterium]
MPFHDFLRELREPYTPRLSGCPLDPNLLLSVIAKTKGGQLIGIMTYLLLAVVSAIWHAW